MAYQLATSLSDVEQYLASEPGSPEIGVDTEASGLDTRRARLAGISLSYKPKEGIYIPVGHYIGQNLPFKPVWERLLERFNTCLPIFFNAKYDRTILEIAAKIAGAPKMGDDFGDALELVYLANPDRKVKRLKEVATTDLKFNMDRFESLFTAQEIKSGALIINGKMPSRCVDYACADADATLRTWNHFRWVLKEFELAVKVDTPLIDIVRKIEHNGGLELNHEYIDHQLEALEARANALREQVFRTVGYKFEIGSPKQLGIALFEKMKIPHLGMTKGKNPIYSTREEVLEKLRGSYPFVELIISSKKVEKARNSYFMKLKRLDGLKLKPRFNFNMFSAPTFRFSAPGGDPEVDGATGVNIQAVSNGEARTLVGVDLRPASAGDDYLSEAPEGEMFLDLKEEGIQSRLTEEIPWAGEVKNLPYVVEGESLKEDEETGWVRQVCFRETCENCPAVCLSRGLDVTRREQKGVRMVPSVRQSFRAPKGYKLISFDYDRQELVIGANMSGEPRWLRALAAGEDLHAMTAAAAFGMSLEEFNNLPKEEKKRKRDIGKTLNFAIFYGATAYTLANKADISQAAADQIYDGFVRGHPILMGWIQKVHIFGRKQGYTTTYFGRKRWLKQFYDDPRPGMKAFADRSAVNTAIQGTGAEVTRIGMVKVERALRKAGYSWKDVAFAAQIHDELMFMVRNELVKETIPIIQKGMEFEVRTWQVQLKTSAKMGDVWGCQKEFKYQDLMDGKLDGMLLAA